MCRDHSDAIYSPNSTLASDRVSGLATDSDYPDPDPRHDLLHRHGSLPTRSCSQVGCRNSYIFRMVPTRLPYYDMDIETRCLYLIFGRLSTKIFTDGWFDKSLMKVR